MEEKSAAELMAENDQLVEQFYKSCDEFIERVNAYGREIIDNLDGQLERERIAHEELMRELKKLAA